MRVITAGLSVNSGRSWTRAGDAVAAVYCCHSSRRLTFKCQASQRGPRPYRRHAGLCAPIRCQRLLDGKWPMTASMPSRGRVVDKGR